MENKRTYTIEINGINQSIKQVDALSDALQFLDKKIKELESRSVSITSSNNGGGGNGAHFDWNNVIDGILDRVKRTFRLTKLSSKIFK